MTKQYKDPGKSESPLVALACATGASSLEAVLVVLCQVPPHKSPSHHTFHHARRAHPPVSEIPHLSIADLVGAWQKALLEAAGWLAQDRQMLGLARLLIPMRAKHLNKISCSGLDRGTISWIEHVCPYCGTIRPVTTSKPHLKRASRVSAALSVPPHSMTLTCDDTCF